MRTFSEGAAAIKQMDAANTYIGANRCKQRTREAFEVPSNGTATAYLSWQSIPGQHKHSTTNPDAIPDNVFVYFSGGAKGSGHVGVQIGSTFYTPGGPRDTTHWYATSVEAVLRAWPNLHLVGWSPMIDGKIPARPVVKPVPPPPLARTTTIRVATNNVMSLPKNPDIMDTLRAAHLASVMMVQECDIYHSELRKIGPHRITASIPEGKTYSNFVLFDPAIWEHVSTKFVKQYDGEAGISYTRRIAVAILKHRALGREFGFISYHSVTAGNDKVRVAMRKEGDAVVRKEIRALKAKGLPVILGADMNRTSNTFKTASIHIRNRIDHLYAWAGTVIGLKKKSSHTIATRSDHDILVAVYVATKKGN